jgi:hypothetical protein
MKRLCILTSLCTLLYGCQITKGTIVEMYKWDGECKAKVYFEKVQDTVQVACPCWKRNGSTIIRKL